MSDIYRRAANTEALVDSADALRMIQSLLRPEPVAGLPEIHLYRAHSGSGLSRLAATDGTAPYWAYPWAGGLALSLYFQERPETVVGRRVMDFGAGSGLVAIAAVLAGAARVDAVETDAMGRAAIAANAALNRVAIEVTQQMPDDTRDIDLVVAGDVFYARHVGRRSLDILDRWRIAGIPVLIGDPYRPHLPRARLRWLRDYPVPDVGSGGRETPSGVFALEAVAPGTPQPNRY